MDYHPRTGLEAEDQVLLVQLAPNVGLKTSLSEAVIPAAFDSVQVKAPTEDEKTLPEDLGADQYGGKEGP